MSPQEFEQALHDAEVKLARLKALYEQWFQGIERLEPSVARKDLERSFEILKRNMPRNTALRFRTAQLAARYGTYGIYWSRISRQIEEGTYKRDIVRAGRKMITATSRRKAAEAQYELDVDVDVDVDDIDEIADEKTDPGIVVSTPAGLSKPSGTPSAPKPTLSFDDGDLDAILGSLAQPAADAAQRGRSTRPLSPFAMSTARPGPGAASATFGKPKDRPVAAAAAAPTPAPAAVAAPAAPKPPPPVAATPVARPPVAAAIPRPAAPVVSKPAAPAPAPAPAAAKAADLDEKQMRAIYSRYVDARRQNNERTDVRYESLAESVQKMMPKLREKHAGKPIDFEIVVQNGKVGLKPKVGG